ncbi:MAG: ATP cone domain-containing protein [Candidatus Aenigmatarchaeota archaeon]|nr:restriction endonuclease [Candidatus Aenigmarchaeota archaeon]
MMYVKKFDGSRQVFDKKKIYRTCIRIGANEQQANEIVNKVSSKIYNGITTKQILDLIFNEMNKFKSGFAKRIDLRQSISMLDPKPDFEIFSSLILKELGYKIKNNLIISGKCVEHEIDIVAMKNDKTLYVEVKHHQNPHAYTGLDIFLQANSTFQSLKDGFALKKNRIDFNDVLIICNTKISDHAKKYADCMHINYLCWNYPDGGLERLVEEKKLYPITIIKDLDDQTRKKLTGNGIIILKQIVESNLKDVSRKAKIGLSKLEEIKEDALKILQIV